jgi:hydroxypyruvate isomerase
MIKLASHLGMNMQKMPFAERWALAQRIGFKGCEFRWRDQDVEITTALQTATGLNVSVLGGTTGGKKRADMPCLLAPDTAELLVADTEKAIAYAQRLHCTRLIMVMGDRVEGWSDNQHRQTIVASLRLVAPMLEKGGVTVVVEPLNTRVDHKDNYVSTTKEAFAIIEAVGSANVKVLYDVYHMQIMEGNIINTIRQHHDLIGYYHVAGVPGRHEPLDSEVNYDAVFNAIVESGYDHFIGLEYKPTMDSEISLRRVYAAYSHLFSESQDVHSQASGQ